MCSVSGAFNVQISDLNVLLRLNNEEFSLVFSDLALCRSIRGSGISFKLNFDADLRSKLMFCCFSVANLTLFGACHPVCFMCNGCDSWFLCFGCVYSYFIIAVTGRLNVELRWNMNRLLRLDFVTNSVSIDFRVWKILFLGGF